MKKFYCFFILFLTVIFGAKDLCAGQKEGLLFKYYETISVPYPVPDNDQLNFDGVNFRLGWNSKAPCTIAVQFVNHGYVDRKLKFCIKDITLKKMIVLDAVHNSPFGSETLKPDSISKIWFGPVNNIKDSFLLRVWDSDSDEFDAAPVSMSGQH